MQNILRVAFSLSCLVLSSLVLSSGANALSIYGERSVIQRTSSSVQSSKLDKLYSEFRKKADYFGALAVDESGASVNAIWNLNSKDEAIRVALQMCKIDLSMNQVAGKCSLYAIAVPRGYNEDNTISSTLSKQFRRYQSKQEAGKFGAFAVAKGTPTYGNAWGYGSKRAAERRALRECEDAIFESHYGIPKRGRKNLKGVLALQYRANEKLNYHKCRIVHLSVP